MASYTVDKSKYIMTYAVTQAENKKQTTEIKDIHIKTNQIS